MTVQQLKCFSVMAEVLHYTKAASQLYVSQPSLSYSISELEKELGFPLFERRENKTHLTQFGESILPYVRVALDKLEAIQIKAYELADPFTGTINLGNIYSISFDFIPRLLERFYTDKENGNITVSCVQGVNRVLIDKLMEGSLDLIVSGESREQELSSTLIFTQELKLVVPQSHPLAGRKTVKIEDLKEEGMISLGPNSNITGHIAACFRARGLEPKFVLSVAECSAMGAFISSEMAVAIAPVVPSFQSNNVCIIPFDQPDKELLGRNIYLQWVKNRYLPPTARKLRDFIVAEFGKPHETNHLQPAHNEG